MTINRPRAVKPSTLPSSAPDSSFRGGGRRLCAALAAALAALLLLSAPAAAQPTISSNAEETAAPDTLISISAADHFDNAGTNPKFTEAVFSTTAYYNVAVVSPFNGLLYVEAKSDAALNAMSPPPDSSFTVTVEVTMANDEGQTATGTITLKTSYSKILTAPPPPPPDWPSLSQTTALEAPPGSLLTIYAADVFDNAGTNARFTRVGRPGTARLHYSMSTISSEGVLYVQAKTEAELNALDSPPDSPFTLTLEMTMTNDEEQTATGDLEFTTEYSTEDEDPVE